MLKENPLYSRIIIRLLIWIVRNLIVQKDKSIFTNEIKDVIIYEKDGV